MDMWRTKGRRGKEQEKSRVGLKNINCILGLEILKNQNVMSVQLIGIILAISGVELNPGPAVNVIIKQFC